MGDWRRVHIIGTCASEEVAALAQAIAAGLDFENHHCLNGGGSLAGLPAWAAEHIDAVGNLAERNYTPDSVAKAVEEKLLPVAPSLTLKIHVGGEYEDATCVATVSVAEGRVVLGIPEMTTIREQTEQEMEINFAAAMAVARQRQQKMMAEWNTPKGAGDGQ
jgi:hypothetical protein